ncbi:MAG: peptidoglycan DD-metalloendopeptidase family protein [Xanthobacteraceae bacterium]|nr:peptidoglycan DD-metalloendopeptidase family protein [Xanthobacteraceae bacterium]
MKMLSPGRPTSWICPAVVAIAVACATGWTMAKPLKRPDHFRPRAAPAAEPAAKPTKSDGAADKSPADALKAHELELNSLRTEQQRTNEAEQKLTAENQALAEERRKLAAALIEGANHIRADEERVTAVETRLHQLEETQTEKRISLTGRRSLIAEVLAALQRVGHRPPPAIFTGAQDALDSIRTAMFLGAVLPQMRAETQALIAELADLVRVRQELAVERDKQASEIATLGAEQKRMNALVEERQKRQLEVERAIEAERQRALALAKQADGLKDLIAKLEQSIEATRRAEQFANRGEEAKSPSAGAGKADDAARLAPTIAFAAAKGTLSLPAIGTKMKEFGVSDGAGGTEKGISIATRAGAQVTAPSDGWVVYAAAYRSYGQLLILNVGGGYHVLLAGMERITVDLGQFVLTGEPVAVMGAGTQVASSTRTDSPTAPAMTSASDSVSPPAGAYQPVLYIEFRKDGTPVDPTPWWATSNSQKVRG